MNQRKYPCEFCDTERLQESKRVTVTRNRQGKWYIFEEVPAWVCLNCGHRYFDAEVASQMEARMKDKPIDARAVEAWAISFADAPYGETI